MDIKKDIIAYKCEYCKHTLFTNIPAVNFDPRIHKKNCFKCHRKMDVWEVEKNEFMEEPEGVKKLRLNKGYVYGKLIYVGLDDFVEESRKAKEWYKNIDKE